MQFYAMLKHRGKKTPKRWGNKRLLLHGVGFRFRKWVKLPQSFLDLTGLSEPEISGAVMKSLVSNYGLTIRKYEDKDAPYISPSPESSETSEDTDEKKEKTGGE